MRGADLLVSILKSAGVDVIFALSGNQIMPVFDACIDADIRVIHVRHEAAAVYMAEGHAQITGGLGVALVTAAPGFAASLGPLVTSRASETPVLLLSGDSPVAQDGAGAFQELDQVSMSSPLTKMSRRPKSVSELRDDTIAAIRCACEERCGPVHIALAFDVLNTDATSQQTPTGDELNIPVTPCKPDLVTKIASTFSEAERPVILTGPSSNRTRDGGLSAAIENALNVPVICMESPRGLNDPSLGALARVVKEADVIASFGKPFDFTLGFGKPNAIPKTTDVLVIDPEQAVLDQARAALGSRLVHADRASIRSVLSALAQRTDTPEIANADVRTDWMQSVQAALAERVQPESGTDEAMHPATLCAAVQTFLNTHPDTILVSDGGEFGQWAQACISPTRRIINGPSGCIGGSIGYAFAAKLAHPEAQVIALMGDGTVGFHFAEFETAHRYGSNFIAIVGNDAQWNAEVEIQKRDYGPNRVFETELNATRYDHAAAGFGCFGAQATTTDELANALSQAAVSNRPAVINVPMAGKPAPTLTGKSGH